MKDGEKGEERIYGVSLVSTHGQRMAMELVSRVVVPSQMGKPIEDAYSEACQRLYEQARELAAEFDLTATARLHIGDPVLQSIIDRAVRTDEQAEE